MKEAELPNALEASLKRGRVSGAYLFFGNDEERKKKAVSRVAQIICCAKKEGVPCGICVGCNSAAKLSHADIRVARDLSIKGMREFRSSLGTGAWSSRSTTVVIERMENMREDAQSLLLKMLEDSPGNTIFLLTALSASSVLGTVQSRVYSVPFFWFQNLEESERILSEDLVKDFSRFRHLSFEERFLYAKTMAQDPERVTQAFQEWLAYARIAFRKQVAGGLPLSHLSRTLRVIKLLQRLLALQRTSSGSSRLALERFMVEL